jgi:NitT/TauT family transport system ATP-binding protein
MNYLSLNSIKKIFGKLEVIKSVTLDVHEREFLVVLGPSGCGKSTLLRVIAGLEDPTSGFASLDGSLISGTGAERGMVFQKYTSFPWLTVRENVEFGLEVRKTPDREMRQTVDTMLERVGLWDFQDVYPSTLSGGMQQRLALARTLAVNPRVLLLDEPFGALDAQTRREMQLLLLDIWERDKPTTIFVTHDIEEAIFLGQRLILSGPRPFSIEYERQIPFAYPRALEIKTSSEFIMLEDEITVKLRMLVRGK